MVRLLGANQHADPDRMVVEILSATKSYYISEEDFGDQGSIVDDEAILVVVGRIAEIGHHQKAHRGQPIEITLVCAARYKRRPEGETEAPPALYSLNLRKGRRSLLAYLSSKAFWPLTLLIDGGSLRFIELRYERPRYGSGQLLSLYLTPDYITPDSGESE